MRAIIQRVTKASVTVGDEVISSIGKGICVLVGISRDDNHNDMEYIVRKILNTRIFDDDNDKRWAKNVMDKEYEVLCVSQFTLYHILKGNKPDFHSALGGDESKNFYGDFLQKMKTSYSTDKIKDGLFGAHMQVHIQNDGPVTITLESPPHVQKVKKDQRQQKWQKQSPKQPNNEENASASGDNSANNTDTASVSSEATNVGSESLDSKISEETSQKLQIDDSQKS